MSKVSDDLTNALIKSDKNDWIIQHAGLDIVPGAAEWERWEIEYKRMNDERISELSNELLMDGDYWNDLQEELLWSKNHEHTAVFDEFRTQINRLEARGELAGMTDLMFDKMRFSYAVTLMESCLSEMLKSLTISNDAFKRNALKGIDELKGLKIPVSDLFDKDPQDIIDKSILNYLSSLLYHNVPKVMNTYGVILGRTFPIPPAGLYGRINGFMSLRHDIAHRNGKKVNGEENEINAHIINSAIENIALFVSFVNNYVNDVLRDQDA